MMKKMAHIVEGKVVNVSKWDGESDWNPREQVVELPTKEYVNPDTGEARVRALAGIGWDYIDGKFIDNRPVEDEFENIVELSEPKEEEEETPQETEGES